MPEAKISRTTTTTVIVATPLGHVTAWSVRQFVAALDEAGIPDNVRVIATHDMNTYHLERLRVQHVIVVDRDDSSGGNA